MRKVNEAFDFDNDSIDIEPEVKKISEKYKLYEILVRAYEEEVASQGFKSLGRNLGNTLRYVFDTSIEIDYDTLDRDVIVWVQIAESPYTSVSFEFNDVKDFYDLAKRFSLKIYEESDPDFKRRFLGHIRNEFKEPINEAFDFGDEGLDYDKDIKENLNRLKLYRKFKRLLHAEVDTLDENYVSSGSLIDLFTNLMTYGLYIGYSIGNWTIGPNCGVKYWNYSGPSAHKESFKLDIGIIEFDYTGGILQHIKDGLDKIVDLLEKRKDDVYDDYLDRCMSNIWVDKFFRDKEKVNSLPYKFVDYINESLDFDDDSNLDDSVKNLADFHRRKERLVNELYKGYGRTLNKPEKDLPKVNGRMILPVVVRRFTNKEFSIYQSYINSEEYTLDDANGNWVEFNLHEGINFLEALKNMADAIYSSGNERLINRIEKHLERYLREEYGS